MTRFATALLVAVLAATTLAPTATGAPATGAAAAAAVGRIERIPLLERSVLSTAGGEDQEVASATLTTEDFNVAAVTWDGDDDGHLTAWMRVRTDDGWTEWVEVHDDHHAPDPGTDARSGTEPFVTESADSIDVRVVSEAGETLPGDLKLEVIDPGPAPSDTAVAELDAVPLDEEPLDVSTDEMSTDALPPSKDADVTLTDFDASPALNVAQTALPSVEAAAEPSVWVIPPRPTIRSRAAWGADETIRRNYGKPIQYGVVLGAFIHHTAGTNSYSSSDVPRLIRGIYRYHVESRDFYDIGYNFLVDRFGRIWEGAYGGIDRAVVGAHTKYYNSQSFSMSVMGDYTSKTPEQAVLSAYERLFAWKLAIHGVTNARGTAQYTNDYASPKPVIAGHRDTKSTACPGQRLYDRRWDIRRGTQARIDAVAADLSLTGPPVTTFGTRSEMTINWNAGEYPVTGRVNQQSFKNGKWVHIRQISVVDGKATIVRTPGSSHSTRLRASSASSPVNIDTRHPVGTSNSYYLKVTRTADLPTLTLSGPATAAKGTSVEMTIAWQSSDGPVSGRVNLQRQAGSSWVHVRQFAVVAGTATTFITPGGTSSYRLRASSVQSPTGVETGHPIGTSNNYHVTVY